MLRPILHILTLPLSWVPSGAQRAAYLAALGLVGIQVGIGIVLKIAQTGGTYAFSPSASVTISEFLKMLLSTMFFWRECKARAASGIQPSTRGGGSGYSPIGAGLPVSDRSGLGDYEKDGDEESASSNGHASSSDKPTGPARPLNMRVFWSYVRGEVTVDVRYGFCNLAMFYVLINNSVSADPWYRASDKQTADSRFLDLCELQDGGSRHHSVNEKRRHIHHRSGHDRGSGKQDFQDSVDSNYLPGKPCHSPGFVVILAANTW
jgi:hypothetical protein